MSSKNNKGGNTNLYKILSAVIVIAIIAAGYFISRGNTGNSPDTAQYLPQQTEGLSENIPGSTEKNDDNQHQSEKTQANEEEPEEYTSPVIEVSTETSYDYYLTFYNDKLLDQHYEKHGKDMGFDSPEEYEEAANKVIFNEETLHKIEKEDGDDVYYLEDTNEFVIVSTDGYIRTYFLPDDGIRYFNRQ